MILAKNLKYQCINIIYFKYKFVIWLYYFQNSHDEHYITQIFNLCKDLIIINWYLYFLESLYELNFILNKIMFPYCYFFIAVIGQWYNFSINFIIDFVHFDYRIVIFIVKIYYIKKIIYYILLYWNFKN